LLIPALFGSSAVFALLHHSLSGMGAIVGQVLDDMHPVLHPRELLLKALRGLAHCRRLCCGQCGRGGGLAGAFDPDAAGQAGRQHRGF